MRAVAPKDPDRISVDGFEFVKIKGIGQLLECVTCGVVVTDPGKHAEWHYVPEQDDSLERRQTMDETRPGNEQASDDAATDAPTPAPETEQSTEGGDHVEGDKVVNE